MVVGRSIGWFWGDQLSDFRAISWMVVGQSSAWLSPDHLVVRRPVGVVWRSVGGGATLRSLDVQIIWVVVGRLFRRLLVISQWLVAG